MTQVLGLANYEFYFGPSGGRGLFFGANHNVDVMRVEGLTDLEVLYSDQQHLLQHGDVPGVHLTVAKVMLIEVEVRKGQLTDAEWRTLIRDVEGAFTVLRTEQHEFHWKLPGEPERFIRARPVRRRRIIDPDSELGIATIEIEFRVADPRTYAAEKVISPVFNTGQFRVVHEGTSEAYPLVVFTLGPNNTRATLWNATTQTRIDIQGGFSAGRKGYADMDKLVRGDQGIVVYDHNNQNKYAFWEAPRKPLGLARGVNQLSLMFAQSVQLHYWVTYL